MRGISSTGGNSPTVGFYYDDTSLTAPSASNEGKIVISPALYDLNRVEVLRGPQGTLYGSGSMGGTIKVVPNAPNPGALDASAETVFADTDHGGFDHAENAMVNLPFGGGLAALRIVGSYAHDAGWIDRVVIAPGEFPLPNGNARGDVLAAPVAADLSRRQRCGADLGSRERCPQAHRWIEHHAVLLLSEVELGRPALHRQRSGHRRALPTVRRFRELLGHIQALLAQYHLHDADPGADLDHLLLVEE